MASKAIMAEDLKPVNQEDYVIVFLNVTLEMLSQSHLT
jgi:hypothetical protein